MTHTQLTQLVQALLDAPQSNPKVKEFAQSWIDAEGTPKQEELTKQLVSVAEQNIRLSTKQSALQALNTLHKSLAKKVQLTYYNTLKTSKLKAQNSVTALPAKPQKILSI